MLSKLSKISHKRHGNLGLGIPHSKIQERVAPSHKKKGQRRDINPQENYSRLQEKKDTKKTKKDIGKWCGFHKSP
jgi:hypothetical protein